MPPPTRRMSYCTWHRTSTTEPALGGESVRTAGAECAPAPASRSGLLLRRTACYSASTTRRKRGFSWINVGQSAAVVRSVSRPSLLLYGFCFALQTSEDFVTICYLCHLAYNGPAASLLRRHAVASFVMGQNRDADANVTTGRATLQERWWHGPGQRWRVLEQQNSECRSLWTGRDHHVLGCARTGLTCCTAPNPACRTRPTVSRSGMQIADPSYIS